MQLHHEIWTVYDKSSLLPELLARKQERDETNVQYNRKPKFYTFNKKLLQVIFADFFTK